MTTDAPYAAGDAAPRPAFARYQAASDALAAAMGEPAAARLPIHGDRTAAQQMIAALTRDRDHLHALAAELTTENGRLRAELGRAQELIAVVRDAVERIDRALAAHDTADDELAAQTATLRLDPEHPNAFIDAAGHRAINANTVTALRQRDEARAALAKQIEETEEIAGELAAERTLLDQLRPLIDAARAWRTTLDGLGDDTSPEEDALAEAIDALPAGLSNCDDQAENETWCVCGAPDSGPCKRCIPAHPGTPPPRLGSPRRAQEPSAPVVADRRRHALAEAIYDRLREVWPNQDAAHLRELADEAASIAAAGRPHDDQCTAPVCAACGCWCHADEPAAVTIEQPDDDHLEVHVNGEVVATANHDEHGWSGMDAVERAALAVARACGARVDQAEG